jgi:hypothetical protein
MAKNPNLNRNQLYLDMANQKTQQTAGGFYVYLKPISGSTQYKSSVLIYYGLKGFGFESAGFTIIGDDTGYTTNDDIGLLTFTKSGTYTVSNNILPETATLISGHYITSNAPDVTINFATNISMARTEDTLISITGNNKLTLLSTAGKTITLTVN